MSNYPSSYNIKSATGKLNNFTLNKSVITTNDFGNVMPIECKMLVPGDKFHINLKCFTRLMPLPCPTYGNIEQITRAFFVPFRFILPHWNDFISNNKSPNSSGGLSSSYIPWISEYEISNIFASPVHKLSTVVTSSVYDFSNADNSTHYNFTVKGRILYKFLRNLGYNISLCPSAGSIKGSTTKLSVLPILAFWKFYIDWIVPARYVNDYSNIRYILENGFPNISSIMPITEDQLAIILQIPSAFLEDDFFTSAFQNPDGYESVVNSDYQLSNPVDATGRFLLNHVNSATGNSPSQNVGALADGSDAPINYYTLKSLGVLQDLINRGKLSGTKIQNYLIAEYGLKPSSDALQLSTYLGSFKDSIMIGDVTSSADTKNGSDGAYLGEFAGKGLGTHNSHFNFETKDHGLLFITTELRTRTMYVQGLRPETMLLDRFDFFQPEFDNLGTEAIPIKALHNDSSYDNLEQVFGFTPTYSKLKTNFDTLSGDFTVNSLGGGNNGMLSSWHLARIFTSDDIDNLYVGKSFQLANNLGNGLSYDRIFQVAEGDHFYQIFQLDIKAQRPMLSISDALEFEHPSKLSKDVKGSISGNPD